MTVDKRTQLLRLARLRQGTRLVGYGCLADYHEGAYECDEVSPYTKSAGNVDARVFVMLQDWASNDTLRGPFDPESARLGHTPNRRTNILLQRLLREVFDVSLAEVYATKLFPFIKPGGMSARIRWGDLVRAAREFALPQIEIIKPALVVCLGLNTYNATRVRNVPQFGRRRESSTIFTP
jgi:hypothetical protein